MWLIKQVVEFVLMSSRIPTVRVTFLICVGALSKTLAALFIESLPMDVFAYYVFTGLLYLTLIGFCGEVFSYVLKVELGLSIDELWDYIKRFFKSDKRD